MKYSTLYFDTNDKILYKHHHNKKGNRHKIRMRKYIDSNICFLEIKKRIMPESPINIDAPLMILKLNYHRHH